MGEVRAEECLDLLVALNAGVPGMLHLSYAHQELVKVCTLPPLAGENIALLSACKTERLPRAPWRSSCRAAWESLAIVARTLSPSRPSASRWTTTDVSRVSESL